MNLNKCPPTGTENWIWLFLSFFVLSIYILIQSNCILHAPAREQKLINLQFSSVQLSCSVMSKSLWHHGLQHTTPPYPSPTPRVYSNSCPLSRWCHPTISFSAVPFSSHPQSFSASVSFQMSQSALCIRWPKDWNFNLNISPSYEYSGMISFRMDCLDLLEVQGTLKSLLPHHSSETSILWHSAFFIVQLSHPYMTTGKTIALTRCTFVEKVIFFFLICCLSWS